jgi:hypothetical protein
LLCGDNALVVFVWLLDFPKDELLSVALLSTLLTATRLLLHLPKSIASFGVEPVSIVSSFQLQLVDLSSLDEVWDSASD